MKTNASHPTLKLISTSQDNPDGRLQPTSQGRLSHLVHFPVYTHIFTPHPHKKGDSHYFKNTTVLPSTTLHPTSSPPPKKKAVVILRSQQLNHGGGGAVASRKNKAIGIM